MDERVNRVESVIGVLSDAEGEEVVGVDAIEGREGGPCQLCSHMPRYNVWHALKGGLPTITISDADYRSLQLPCDALKE